MLPSVISVSPGGSDGTVISVAITTINLVTIGNVEFRLRINTRVFPSVNILCDVHQKP